MRNLVTLWPLGSALQNAERRLEIAELTKHGPDRILAQAFEFDELAFGDFGDRPSGALATESCLQCFELQGFLRIAQCVAGVVLSARNSGINSSGISSAAATPNHNDTSSAGTSVPDRIFNRFMVFPLC